MAEDRRQRHCPLQPRGVALIAQLEVGPVRRVTASKAKAFQGDRAFGGVAEKSERGVGEHSRLPDEATCADRVRVVVYKRETRGAHAEGRGIRCGRRGARTPVPVAMPLRSRRRHGCGPHGGTPQGAEPRSDNYLLPLDSHQASKITLLPRCTNVSASVDMVECLVPASLGLAWHALDKTTQEESTQTNRNIAKPFDIGVAIARNCMLAARVFK